MHPLTQSQRTRFQKDGFLILKHFFSAALVHQMQQTRDTFLENQAQYQEDMEFLDFSWGDRLAERLYRAHQHANVFEDIKNNRELLQLIAKLLQTTPEHVLFLKDKLIFKPPLQEGYQPHQDLAFWRKDGVKEALSAIVAIDDCHAKNGGVSFLPGSHQALLTEVEHPRNLTAHDLNAFQNSWVLPELQAGDLLVFHGLTIHQSAQNVSTQYRSTYYLSFYVSDASA